MTELAITIQRGESAQNDVDVDGDPQKNNFYKFFLQSEDLLITHKRTPIVSSLPGSDPIILDLGQWQVDIKVEGVADIPVYVPDPSDPTIFIKRREKHLSDPDMRYTPVIPATNPIAIPIADKDDLESIASPRTNPEWYNKTILVKDYSYSYGLNNPAVYNVKIESISINKRSVNTFYNFILQASGLLEPK